ncbi:MAG: tetratricopeptide repeat protein, partial [Ignavibacteriales bacterium]
MGIDIKYSIEHRFKSAHDFESSGLNLHAMQIYYSILNDNPQFTEAGFSLAELFEKQGNINSAKNLLSNSLNENPSDNFARLYFAQFLLRNSLWEDVIDVVQS